MADEVERLIGVLAGDAASKLLPFVPNRANPQAELALLLQEPQEVASAAVRNESYRMAVEAVAADADLGRIAPLGEFGPVLSAITGWHRISANDLVTSLLGAAAAELRCFALEPEPAQLVEIALRNVELVRRIARGESVEVITFLGFNGVSLQDGMVLDLPWGTVTQPVGWYGIAEVFQTRPTSCVLLARHRLSISIDELSMPPNPAPGDDVTAFMVHAEKVPKPIKDHQEWTLSTLQLTSLSVVLATPTNRVAPLSTFHFTLLPYESPMGASSQLVLAPPSAARMLTEQERVDVERWARIGGDRFTHTLEVAARRTIAGLSQRLDPADRLIDAVTAWESLFSAQVEASFRVTGAIAALLQPDDATKRDELQRDLVKIYNLRSDVVHGRSANQELVYTRSFEATEFAIEALAAMLERRPELIALDPGERSRRLLLGLPGGTSVVVPQTPVP